jgi:hypothetical protein
MEAAPLRRSLLKLQDETGAKCNQVQANAAACIGNYQLTGDIV